MKKLFLIGAVMVVLAFEGAGQNQTPEPASVPLNHFFVTVDSATYAAIEQSEFLRKEFAPNETRTTVRADRTYTGIYFYGVNTYFEFFDAGKESGRRQGDSGIAFGTDVAGTLKAIEPRLASEFQATQTTVTRQVEGRHVDWFFSLGPKVFAFDSGLSTWIMEYHPRFLAEWHAESDSLRGIGRKQVLGRYAAVLKERPGRPFLEDVVEIVLAAPDPARTKLARFCKLLGYRRRAAGDTIILEGPDIALRLVAEAGDRRGIQQVTLRVNRAPEKTGELRFGPRSALRFNTGGTATWIF